MHPLPAMVRSLHSCKAAARRKRAAVAPPWDHPERSGCHVATSRNCIQIFETGRNCVHETCYWRIRSPIRRR